MFFLESPKGISISSNNSFEHFFYSYQYQNFYFVNMQNVLKEIQTFLI